MSYPTCPRCGHAWHALPCRTATIRASPSTDEEDHGWDACGCPADAPLPIPAGPPGPDLPAGPHQHPQEPAA